MTETWKTIAGFENYQISDKGRVKSLNYAQSGIERIMKSDLTNDGYLRIRLRKNSIAYKYYVHRLVALHFIPNPTYLPSVNHINGNRTDNRVENLEWISYSENQLKSNRKPKSQVKGEAVFNSKLTEEKVRKIRRKKEKGYNYSQLSREYKVSTGAIKKVVLRYTWKHVK